MGAPAGFWRRYAAYSLDALVVAGLSLPLARVPLRALGAALEQGLWEVQRRLWALVDADPPPPGEEWAYAQRWATDPALREAMLAMVHAVLVQVLWLALAVGAVGAVYFIATEASGWQASPGKRLLGLRVVRADGGRAGPARIALRFAAGIPSWLALHLGHALAALPPARRALHDRLAGTAVVLAPGAPAAMPAWARGWLAGQLALLLAGVLGLALWYVVLLLEAMQGVP